MNLRSLYSNTNTKCPPKISPPEYKPPKKCLQTSISPGLLFGILRYVCIIFGYLQDYNHSNIFKTFKESTKGLRKKLAILCSRQEKH